jgi:hypothetical protein
MDVTISADKISVDSREDDEAAVAEMQEAQAQLRKKRSHPMSMVCDEGERDIALSVR